MGWDGNESWKSKKDVKDAIKVDYNSYVEAWLAESNHGIEWYVTVRLNGKTVILVFLIEKHDGCWAYKMMTENEGPYFFNPSAAVLDAATDEASADTGRAWRAKCRKVLARVKNGLPAGTTVLLGGEPWVVQGPYKPGKVLVHKPGTSGVYQVSISQLEVAND
jgi:hypothetical protein